MQDNKERKMSENTGSFIKKKRQYQEMGMKILHICRSEICARFPFFSYASAALSAVMETKMFPNSMGNENSSQSWSRPYIPDLYVGREARKVEKRLPAHVVSLSLSASFF